MKTGFPRAYAGETIGLFGGSFDPAHEGHAHVAQTALKRLKLDRVWWLVSPQNPLKPASNPLRERMAHAQLYAKGARMEVTDLETRLGVRFSYETIRAAKRLYPGVRFVFIMGSDSLASFRLWKNWREIAKSLPIAIISRPGFGPKARRIGLKNLIFINAREHAESSSAIRQGRLL